MSFIIVALVLETAGANTASMDIGSSNATLLDMATPGSQARLLTARPPRKCLRACPGLKAMTRESEGWGKGDHEGRDEGKPKALFMDAIIIMCNHKKAATCLATEKKCVTETPTPPGFLSMLDCMCACADYCFEKCVPEEVQDRVAQTIKLYTGTQSWASSSHHDLSSCFGIAVLAASFVAVALPFMRAFRSCPWRITGPTMRDFAIDATSEYDQKVLE